ncbi:MAG: hypothetical protein O7C59_05655 [Rickettsia endosymbiont of Ixodes persulcatus]|nr:hypothetical protein [Rickettsia endosymbiont of Ixodes persulcatus]
MDLNNFPIAITFDIDWAPDFAIKKCASICRDRNIPATFFSTHRSEFIDELLFDNFFEVGIHPNFLQNSSHGLNEIEVMETMSNIVPHAVSMRTHGLYQTSNLFLMIMKKFRNIKFDFSLYIPNNKFIIPYQFFFKDNFIYRIPYQWEDDLYFYNKSIGEILFKKAYYQIFNFHPMHVLLNSEDEENYTLLKESLSCPLMELKIKKINYINTGIGTRNYLEKILDSVEPHRFCKARDILASISSNKVKDSLSLNSTGII